MRVSVDIHVAFEHELRVGRHLQVDGAALHQVHRLAAQEAGEEHLVHAPAAAAPWRRR